MFNLYLSGVFLLVTSIIIIFSMIYVTRRKFVLLFFIIPILLITSVLSINSLQYFKGIPIDGYPTEEVQILTYVVNEPDIYIISRNKKQIVRVYKIPYTEEKQSQMERLGKSFYSFSRSGETSNLIAPNVPRTKE